MLYTYYYFWPDWMKRGSFALIFIYFLYFMKLLQIIFEFYFFCQVCIVKLKMTKSRKRILENKAAGRAAAQGKDKEKFTAMDTSS